MSIQNLSRRRFMFGLSAVSAGLLLGIELDSAHAKMPEHASDDESFSFSPDVFVSIDSKGQVTIICHRSEMGQGVRSTLPLLIADEMEADWDRVTVEQAIADEKYGSQNTDGSRSVRRNYRRLREAGATARTMLQQAAANHWGVKPEECEVYNHVITHKPSGKTLDFAEVVKAAAELDVPAKETLQLKPENKQRYIGRKDIKLLDGKDIVTGNTTYGYDVQLDDLHIAVIARPPVLFGKPKSFDASEALKIPGVVEVVEMPTLTPPALFKPLGGIAVLATNTWAAMKGREALKIEWDHGDYQTHNTEEHKAVFKKALENPPHLIRKRGDIANAQAKASKTLEAEYYVGGIAHTTMEPPAATARVTKDGIECWACTQTPQSSQRTVASLLGIEDKEKVIINVTLLGGGFGRKSKPDFVAEAAWLANKTKKAVKVLWTREDEIKHGYYHSPSYQTLKGTLDENGKVTSWHHSMVNHPIGFTFNAEEKKAGGDSLGQGDMPFDIPNILINNGESESFYRIGWLRSVTNINNAFAASSFADELANAAGRDSKDFLLELIGEDRHINFKEDGYDYWNYGDSLEQYPVDTARLKNVIRQVAEKGQWNRKLKPGHGIGIAAHRSFCTYVATMVEVSFNDGKLKIEQVDTAVDCGKILNPERVESQMAGAAVFSASFALHGEITARNGIVEQSNFDDYPLLRIQEAPVVNVYQVQTNEIPAGVGEPGVPPFAPALTNAIFNATGKRYRNLPLSQYGIV